MSMYPENPAGQTFISQDTYASAGAALSGLGGGGGNVGPVLNGIVTINASPTQDFLINQQNDYEVSLQNNNGNNDITIKADGSIQFNYNNDYGVIIDPTGRSIEIYPGSRNPEGALEGISTINGVGVGAFTGSIPANLAVSTLTAANSVSTLALNVSSINGAAPGGGGSVPANLAVSTLTVQGQGAITLNTDPDYLDVSAPLVFNTQGQETEAAGQLQLTKQSILSLGLTSTLSGLCINALSSGFGQYQPVAAKSLILGGDNNDASKPGAEIGYAATTSTLSMYAPNVNISSLVGVSSINGVAYTAGGGVPANLTVSSLTVQGQGGVFLNSDFDYPGQSAVIVFESVNQTTEAQGILALNKQPISGLGLSTLAGLAVKAISTGLGTYQPIAVGGILIDNPYSTPGPSASLVYNNAGNTLNLNAPNVNISSLVGISSINGGSYFAPRYGIFTVPTGGTEAYYDIPNPPAGITPNAVVLCTLTVPDGSSQNWIVDSSVVQGATPANWYIKVTFASAVASTTTAVAWALLAPNCIVEAATNTPT